MDKGFTQTVDCKSIVGEKAFTNVLYPRSCFISIIIYIFQDLKRNDAKTAARGKFSRM